MDIGILLLRLTVGLVLAAHGSQKVFGWFGGHGLDGTGQFMEMLGFRPGRRHALVAGLVELTGGLLLAVGFLTPLGAALTASVMVVAAATVHAKSFFVTSGGFEFNLLIGVAALAVAFTGPGALSLDAVVGYTLAGGAWGAGAAAVAVLGAIAQLARRQRVAAAA
ncbi:MAG: DoxX family protein [Acidobacteria bacterium]|nr:DoxX family protein [Acidobacteriota bacterium]